MAVISSGPLHFFTQNNAFQTHADSIMSPPPCVLLCLGFNYTGLNSHYHDTVIILISASPLEMFKNFHLEAKAW